MFSRNTLFGLLCVSGLALLPMRAFAFDIRPSCDFRNILALNEAQRERLHVRRQQYKDELRQIDVEKRRRRGEISLRGFFVKAPFDRAQANRLAQEKYHDDVQRAVAELNFYHDLFQMLTPNQRDLWLRRCVQDPMAGRL